MLDRPVTAAQDQDFRVVIEAIGDHVVLGNSQPIDILAFQEGPENASEYEDIEENFEAVHGGNFESTFTPADSFGCRTGFIYNTQTVDLITATSLISGLTHNSRRAQFRPIGGSVADEFFIYAIHLKAGSSNSDELRREDEAQLIRANANTLPSSRNIIYAGDLNMKGSFEPAYSVFRATGSNSTAFDSLNAPFGFQPNADWVSNLALQPFHSQAPLNMNDRFDLLFLNERFFDDAGIELVVGSTTALGNNGSHTMNSAVISGNGADGFADELLAFSDHLPVFSDFKFGQTPPASSQPFSANSILTRTVRTSGPVGGSTGDDFLNIEGTDHPGFESFAVVDFDLTGNPTAGSGLNNVVMKMLQSNAGFSSNGPLGIYVTTAAAAQVPIDSTIRYVAGQDELDCVPAILSNGAQKVSTYASIHRNANNSVYPNGTEDPIVLYGDALDQAILSALSSNGLLRFLIVPDEADTAATFAGFTNSLGPITLTGDVVDGTGGTEDTFPTNLNLLIGDQGFGTFEELVESDDNVLTFFSQAQNSSDAISIQVNFISNLPISDPSSLSITMESKVRSPNLNHTIEIFDFVGADWEVVQTSASTLNDTVVVGDANGDITRFVGPSNLVFSRVSWNATGPVIMFPWGVDVDVFKWTTTE